MQLKIDGEYNGESYPEMNNILELCKIFNCKLNDLVHTDMTDITSLDEEIVMNVVKFNEKKQKEVKTLNNNIKEKDNEISFLKSKISSLKNTIEYWKDNFDKLISFLYSKLHNWYDKDDKYIDVVNDMYEDNVLDDDDIKELKLSKEKDDFER